MRHLLYWLSTCPLLRCAAHRFFLCVVLSGFLCGFAFWLLHIECHSLHPLLVHMLVMQPEKRRMAYQSVIEQAGNALGEQYFQLLEQVSCC